MELGVGLGLGKKESEALTEILRYKFPEFHSCFLFTLSNDPVHGTSRPTTDVHDI